MRGYIDECTREGVAGWAIAADAGPVELVVEADGEVVGRTLAQEYRQDLQRDCGFRIAFSPPLGRPRWLRVYVAGSDIELQNSPFDFRHRLAPLSAEDVAWTQGLSLPPLEEMRLVGSETPEIFVAQGARTALALRDHIVEFFGDFSPELRILDFGCGVGRALLPLARRFPARWCGCDVNDRAIAYLGQALPEAQVFVNGFYPPLPAPDKSFDCVLSVSVWTHLPLGLHLPWLADIRRVLRPGGLALISTSGSHVVDVRRRRGDPGWGEIHAEDLEEAGVIYRPYPKATLRGIPSSYGLAAHHPEHVRRVWSSVMPVLKTSVRALEAMQDLHVLTRT